MCELIGRVDADPDVLPRTENFGVDYIEFSKLCPTCPPEFLELTYNCVKVLYLLICLIINEDYIFVYLAISYLGISIRYCGSGTHPEKFDFWVPYQD